MIGCIKSSLLKKQSGEFNIEPLVGVVNPMTKCFIIEPHKVGNILDLVRERGSSVVPAYVISDHPYS